MVFKKKKRINSSGAAGLRTSAGRGYQTWSGCVVITDRSAKVSNITGSPRHQPAHVSGGNSRRAARLDSCFATGRAIVRGRSSHSPIRLPKDTRTERLNITSGALPRFRVMRCLTRLLQDAFGTDGFDCLISVGRFTFNNRKHLESGVMWQ